MCARGFSDIRHTFSLSILISAWWLALRFVREEAVLESIMTKVSGVWWKREGLSLYISLEWKGKEGLCL